MNWKVEFHPDFLAEYRNMPEHVRCELLSLVNLLRIRGPRLGRPYADTLNGSEHSNLKELRLLRTWRVAFAFNKDRTAILLAAGDKKGKKERRFYRTLIDAAESRIG